MAKVRITGLGNNGKQMNWPMRPDLLSAPSIEVNNTLKPVDEEDANLEAEKGETVVADMVGDGIPQQYKVGGKRHSEGGTPLDLPGQSFVFSRDKGMYIKDEKIQKMFGMAPDKKGYAPADIAKKYDLNKYRKVLADPDADDLQVKTAEMMIAQFNMKLAKLALVQESLKGFPQGIPKIAEPYVAAGMINPEDLAVTQAQPEVPGGTMMQYGGGVKRKVKITTLPKAQNGTGVPTKEELAALNAQYLEAEAKRAEQKKVKEMNTPVGPGIFEKIFDFGLQGVKPLADWYYNPEEDVQKMITLQKGAIANGGDAIAPMEFQDHGKEVKLKTYNDLLPKVSKKALEKTESYEKLQNFYKQHAEEMKPHMPARVYNSQAEYEADLLSPYSPEKRAAQIAWLSKQVKPVKAAKPAAKKLIVDGEEVTQEEYDHLKSLGLVK